MPLMRLIAENVGPFERLDVDFSDGNGKPHPGPHILAESTGRVSRQCCARSRGRCRWRGMVFLRRSGSISSRMTGRGRQSSLAPLLVGLT
jgi:hypothetical protein